MEPLRVLRASFESCDRPAAATPCRPALPARTQAFVEDFSTTAVRDIGAIRRVQWKTSQGGLPPRSLHHFSNRRGFGFVKTSQSLSLARGGVAQDGRRGGGEGIVRRAWEGCPGPRGKACFEKARGFDVDATMAASRARPGGACLDRALIFEPRSFLSERRFGEGLTAIAVKSKRVRRLGAGRSHGARSGEVVRPSIE